MITHKEFVRFEDNVIDSSELKSSYLQLFNHNRELTDSMHYAATIQQGLLPHTRHFERLCKEHFVIYKPQHIIGGDFYWIGSKDDRVIIASADCTGHGVSGCMLSVLGISLLNYVVLGKEFDDLGMVLQEIDKKWIETFSTHTNMKTNNDWMDISICSYDKNTGELCYAAANSRVILADKEECVILKGDNFPIGGWQVQKDRLFTQQKIKIKPDTRIYMGSDGLRDQFDGKNKKKYSRKRLLDYLHDIYDVPMHIQEKLMRMQIEEWQAGNTQTDDICLMGLKFS